MSPTTVVSGLFDLAAREGNAERATVAQYLDWGELLLGLDANLVCFTEPAIESSITERREQHHLLARTEIVTLAWESLPSYHLLDRARQARQRNPLRNGKVLKDTILHAVLNWSKFELLRQAIETNPFGDRHFIWADFGLSHVAKTEHCIEDRVFKVTPDLVRILQMRPLEELEGGDRAHHLAYRRGHFAGGVISGDAEHLRTLAAIVGEELESSLEQGLAPIDEQLLELAVMRAPELFSFHYGDYDHILENYARVRGSADNLAFQLRCWRGVEDWQPAGQLAGQVLAAIEDGSFEAQPGALAALLEECFLASYYSRAPDQSQARAVASLYAERAHRDPEFREQFLAHEIRVRTNFAFVEQSV